MIAYHAPVDGRKDRGRRHRRFDVGGENADGAEGGAPGQRGGNLGAGNRADHRRARSGRPCPPTTSAKGNYYTLSGRSPFTRPVYPVPEKAGLGVHVTVDLAGQARFGPDVEWVDSIDYDVDPGRADAFYAAIRRYWPGLPDGAIQAGYSRDSAQAAGAGRARRRLHACRVRRSTASTVWSISTASNRPGSLRLSRARRSSSPENFVGRVLNRRDPTPHLESLSNACYRVRRNRPTRLGGQTHESLNQGGFQHARFRFLPSVPLRHRFRPICRR